MLLVQEPGAKNYNDKSDHNKTDGFSVFKWSLYCCFKTPSNSAVLIKIDSKSIIITINKHRFVCPQIDFTF